MMEHLNDYSDERNKIFCPYCGKTTEPKNRDHVPSKAFLDKPYPPELPIIYPCAKCNTDYAEDEEYVACFIECMRAGSTNKEEIQREKIQRTLDHSPFLMDRLQKEFRQFQEGKAKKQVSERIERILLKLARGHAAFEFGEPFLKKPDSIEYASLASLSAAQLVYFESPPKFSLLAEVGSRALQRQIQIPSGVSEWIVVQPGRYRYLTLYDERIEIRFVFSEHLTYRVEWGKRGVD